MRSRSFFTDFPFYVDISNSPISLTLLDSCFSLSIFFLSSSSHSSLAFVSLCILIFLCARYTLCMFAGLFSFQFFLRKSKCVYKTTQYSFFFSSPFCFIFQLFFYSGFFMMPVSVCTDTRLARANNLQKIGELSLTCNGSNFT